MNLKEIRPVWAEINLDHLAHNIKEVRKLVGSKTLITSVVKADAYGHGVEEVSNTFLQHGADRLAVATLGEAIQLRQAGFTAEILVLGYTPLTQVKELVDYNIIQTVYNYETAKTISQYAAIKKTNHPIHLKIDTGMNRLGFLTKEETLDQIEEIYKLPYLYLEGIYTHFARADERDKKTTHQQFQQFTWLLEKLEKKGINFPITHCANSATIIDLPEYHLDMVRAGIMLYGLYPSKDVLVNKVHLKPAMILKARIANIKYVNNGEGISYGHIYHTNKRTKIGTLPIGYADGYTRLLSNRATVSVHGKSVPLVGRICMDQCMINLEGMDQVHIGDEVTLFGDGKNNSLHIDDVADLLGTINYEVVCMVGRRVPRVYIKDTVICGAKNYL